MNLNYAYLHCRPDGTPFYAGKGKLRRANNLRGRNPHHTAIVSKYGVKAILIGAIPCSNEATAYELEQGLIKCLVRMGVPLANYTAGGDGGKSPCASTRAKLVAAAKRRGVSEAFRKAAIAAATGRTVTPEERLKQSERMKGRQFTEAHRASIKASAVKRGVTKEVLAAAWAASRGRVQSDEEKLRRQEAALRSWDLRGRKPKVAKGPRKNPWETLRKPSAVLVDGVLYPSIKSAAAAIGVTSGSIIHALKYSGVTQGRRVSRG